MKATQANREGRKYDPFSMLKVGTNDRSVVRITVAKKDVTELKARMDMAPIFHATGEYHWDYVGHFPICTEGLGMLTFGDSVLDPETGDLVAHPMTPRRASALIRELRHVCIGFEVGCWQQPPSRTPRSYNRCPQVRRSNNSSPHRATVRRFRCWTLTSVLNQTTT